MPETKPLPEIEVHPRLAPTLANQGTAAKWSLGILNLTQAECDEITAFARALRSDKIQTAVEARPRPWAVQAAEEERAERLRAITVGSQAILRQQDQFVREVEYHADTNTYVERRRAKDGSLTTRTIDPKEAQYLYGLLSLPEMVRPMKAASNSDDRDDAERDAARQPEPDEPRNRFSGLDLDLPGEDG